MHGLATSLQTQGKRSEAEPLFVETLERRRRALGNDHPDTLMSIGNVAAMLQRKGKLVEAERLQREAFDASRRIFGEDHPHTITYLNNLATLCLAQRRPNDAIPLLREVLERRRRIQGDDHLATLTVLNNLGLTLLSNGGGAEAEPLLAELYRRAKVAQAAPKERAVYLVGHGYCLTALGKYAEADAPLRDAYEQLVATGQSRTPPMRVVLESLVKVCAETGRAEESRKWQAELDRFRAATQPAPPASAPTTQP
jgi:tetratricopeptide (TPR) repeat protein